MSKDETTKAGADTSQSGDSSQGNAGSTSQEQTKTYQESEVQKIVNDRLAQAGRDVKTLEAQKADLAAREEAHAQWQKEKDEEDYEKARGNPEALSALQRERADRDTAKTIKDERAALERDKLAHQVEIDAANAIKKENDIAALATKYQIDVQVLKDLDLDSEHTEKVAQRLTTLSPEALGQVNKATVPKKRDSGVTLGGGSTGLADLSPKERLKAIDQKLREN